MRLILLAHHNRCWAPFWSQRTRKSYGLLVKQNFRKALIAAENAWCYSSIPRPTQNIIFIQLWFYNNLITQRTIMLRKVLGNDSIGLFVSLSQADKKLFLNYRWKSIWMDSNNAELLSVQKEYQLSVCPLLLQLFRPYQKSPNDKLLLIQNGSSRVLNPVQSVHYCKLLILDFPSHFSFSYWSQQKKGEHFANAQHSSNHKWWLGQWHFRSFVDWRNLCSFVSSFVALRPATVATRIFYYPIGHYFPASGPLSPNHNVLLQWAAWRTRGKGQSLNKHFHSVIRTKLL